MQTKLTACFATLVLQAVAIYSKTHLEGYFGNASFNDATEMEIRCCNFEAGRK